MKRDSVQNRVTLAAFEKGYKVNKRGAVIGVRGNKLSLNKNNKGYYRFSMKHEGRTVAVMVHKLQAYQKFGEEAFHEDIVVRHSNDREYDNSYKNLILGTQLENMADKRGKKYKKRK